MWGGQRFQRASWWLTGSTQGNSTSFHSCITIIAINKVFLTVWIRKKELHVDFFNRNVNIRDVQTSQKSEADREFIWWFVTHHVRSCAFHPFRQLRRIHGGNNIHDSFIYIQLQLSREYANWKHALYILMNEKYTFSRLRDMMPWGKYIEKFFKNCIRPTHIIYYEYVLSIRSYTQNNSHIPRPTMCQT